MARERQPARIEFGKMVGDLRNRKGFLKKDLAIAVGKTASAVSLWEQGRRVPRKPEDINILAGVLEATDEERVNLLNVAGFGQDPILPSQSIEVLRIYETF